jgi:hypothetical protein
LWLVADGVTVFLMMLKSVGRFRVASTSGKGISSRVTEAQTAINGNNQ